MPTYAAAQPVNLILQLNPNMRARIDGRSTRPQSSHAG